MARGAESGAGPGASEAGPVWGRGGSRVDGGLRGGHGLRVGRLQAARAPGRRVVEGGDQVVGLAGAVVAGQDGRDQLPHAVDGAQQGVDRRRGALRIAAAQPLEDLLHGVGDPQDVGQADHRGGTLQGVGLAEHRGEQLLVLAVALQLQQQLAQGGQPPLGLLGEHGPEARLLAGDLHLISLPAGGAGAIRASGSSITATRSPAA